MRILTGHYSPDTAYVVEDYPYGFRLRCRIRYWLEYDKKHGVRLVSQTSNPKKPGLVWNKPRASIYCKFGGAMYLNEENHVTWSGAHEYMDTAGCEAWRNTYGAGLSPEAAADLDVWIKMKRAYDAKVAAGQVKVITTTTTLDGTTTVEETLT